MASGFWTQAAIARARPERAEAFSREADDGGCSAAQLSSGIGGLQQPTMLLERPVQAARCAKQQWKQQRLTRWMLLRPRWQKRGRNGIGRAAMPDDAFRELIEQHAIQPATGAKPDAVFCAQVEQNVKGRSGQTRWAAKPGPPQPGRRMSVRLADLMRYGYTSRCLRCEYLKRYTSGCPSSVPHSESCRTRIGEALAKDPHQQWRFQARLRMGMLLAELGEQ